MEGEIRVKTTHYPNAISFKFDNRRVTVSDTSTGTALEFRTIDHNYAPHTINQCIRGIMALTYLELSNEASELLLRGLADRLGYNIIKQNKE